MLPLINVLPSASSAIGHPGTDVAFLRETTNHYKYKTYYVIMEKEKEGGTSYKGLSPHEYHLLSLMEKSNMVVFGVKEARQMSTWDKQRVYNTLSSLEKKGFIQRIKRNAYVIASDVNEHLFAIATEVVKPSYISFWTALSFYGFTEQQINTVQVVTPKQVRDISIDSFRVEVTTFQPYRFYGYTKVDRFAIAEPEKALVDSLAYPDKCGGWNECAKCLKNAWEHIDKRRFTDYLIQFNNKSVVSRVGYLIEHMGLEKTQNMERLRRYTSKSFVPLNPKKKRKGDYNKRWKIIVNQKIRVEEPI